MNGLHECGVDTDVTGIEGWHTGMEWGFSGNVHGQPSKCLPRAQTGGLG